MACHCCVLSAGSWRRLAAESRENRTETFLEKHEDAVRWFTILIGGVRGVRFVLEHLGLWPWE